MAGTGAILTLSANGKQDEYLTSNVVDTFWDFKSVKHTHFTLFYKSRSMYRNVSPATNWPFGSSLTFNINPKTAGDVLTNAYLKLTLPALSIGYAYCGQIGNALIKEYSFRVNETIIQTVPGDWNIIHDDLYAENAETYAKRFLLNGGEGVGLLPPSNANLPVYVPLNFFFSRTKNILPGNWMNNISTGSETNSADTYHAFFLTCACTKQQIYVDITFNPVTFFSNVTTSLSVENVQLVTEEATLSPEEVVFYRSQRQTNIYNTVSKQPKLRVDKGQGVVNSTTPSPPGCDDKYKDELVTNIPVKAFHWFLRDQRYEDPEDPTYFLNRYNFSSNSASTVTDEYLYQILSDARVYINGHSQIGFLGKNDPPFVGTAGANYYRYVIPSTHGFTTPDRNIYTYSFALNPREPSPSGALDFSIMDSSKTYINGHIQDVATSNTYNVSTLFIGYIFLKYENDFCSLLFN